jgi:hypothetical protein
MVQVIKRLTSQPKSPSLNPIPWGGGEKETTGVGIVVHVHNPNYSGGRDRRITVRNQTREMLLRPYLKNKPNVVVRAYNSSYFLEVEVGPWSKAVPSKSRRPYLKNKLK